MERIQVAGATLAEKDAIKAAAKARRQSMAAWALTTLLEQAAAQGFVPVVEPPPEQAAMPDCG